MMCVKSQSFYFKKGEDPSDSEGTKPIQQFAPKARTKRNRVPPRELGVGIYKFLNWNSSGRG
ncbi:hypothetical protein L6258_01175 [Candidatus Parcubacteria bacterium]|nr:hypothetical protein [Candidatus Parcubacteria bacterium]